ncbi:sodium:proton antiporter [Helicobacter sp. MIT 14-3879]|nr:Na+/H+ antiporter NhaC family protein [Helicobacter sp. MIT 14-3879]RDU65450.1 sodium:proton antiporter [Helicobacter sp. MIT 14-3879]
MENLSDSPLSLLVPLCVITLVFITRRVALSLLCGILLGGILLFYNKPLEILIYVYKNLSSIFYTIEDSKISINFSNIYVFGFLVILGVLSQMILYSGAVNAFVSWAHKRVNSAQGSEFIAFIAGIVIFIDDYFNALTVGQISKSLNDANKSSRERLAYIIDSTSAPVCILMPISSWGAYIIGVMDKNIPKDFGDSLFLLTNSIWSNYYAWFALFCVFLTIIWQVNLPSMQKNVNIGVNDVIQKANINDKISSIWLLIIPILVLIISISSMLFYSGYVESSEPTLMNILANTNPAFSLFYGGLLTLIVSFVISYKHLKYSYYMPIVKAGFLGMLPAIIILILAWAIGPVIRDDMQTGIYLANISKDLFSSNTTVFIPIVLFVIAAFIAFCTGTSWGTFAILIPIGVEVVVQNGGNLTLCLSAILAGAVFGDHSSPISDTTILSATGAGCSVQSHFITQLPYVASVALVSLISFIIASFVDSVLLGYVIGLILLIGLFYFYKIKVSKPLRF